MGEGKHSATDLSSLGEGMGVQQLEKGTWTVVSGVQAQDAPQFLGEKCSLVMQHHDPSLKADGSPHCLWGAWDQAPLVQLGKSREDGLGFTSQLKY